MPLVPALARALLPCLLALATGPAQAGPLQDAALPSPAMASQPPAAPPMTAETVTPPAGAATGPGDGEAAQRGTGLRLVTLNLYHDRDDWQRRRTQIVDTLRQLQPDAVALQEVLEDDGLPNQAAWLANALGYAWYFVTTDPPSRHRRYGNGLLTRQPAIEDAQTLLHPLEDHRVALMARLLVDGRPLNVYVTHLHWTPEGGAIRGRQVQDLMAWIAATADGAASVVAGDFNAEADAPELAPLQQRHDDAWQVVHPGADADAASTLNPHYYAGPARIDHVFVERGLLRPVLARLLFTTPDAEGVWASDHRGLMVQLEWAQATPAPHGP